MIVFRIFFGIIFSVMFIAITPLWLLIEFFKLVCGYDMYECLKDIWDEYCDVWCRIWGEQW